MADWKKVEAQLRKTINDINVVTEGNDTNIVDGVDRLIRGYEGGTGSTTSIISNGSILFIENAIVTQENNNTISIGG